MANSELKTLVEIFKNSIFLEFMEARWDIEIDDKKKALFL
jgi:hypothetical protein